MDTFQSPKRKSYKSDNQMNGEHHLAIPNHNPIKIGTLNAILRQVAAHLEKSKDDIYHELFS